MAAELNNALPGDSQMQCFRCGACCMGPRVVLTLSEARYIADAMGLSLPVWRDRYTQWQWIRGETCYLRQEDGACIFLQRSQDVRVASCAIQSHKPLACRLFTSSLYRRQCQEGLEKFWGIVVGPWALEGSKERLREFRSFLESLDYPRTQ